MLFKKLITILILLTLNFNLIYAKKISGEEILKRVDKNFTAENRISVSSIIIKGRRTTRTVQSKTWTQGNNKAFTEYLSPVREKGTKMLKINDQLWIWSPSTDRTIKIAGHMLRQSMLGSDISYEDFMEDPNLHKNYNVQLLKQEETINNRACHVLKLTAKKESRAYHHRKIWVDKQRFLPLKENLFAKSGKLLKTFTIIEVFKMGSRWYPKKMVFKDILKKGKGTGIIIESIQFNTDIPEHLFTKASLRR